MLPKPSNKFPSGLRTERSVGLDVGDTLGDREGAGDKVIPEGAGDTVAAPEGLVVGCFVAIGAADNDVRTKIVKDTTNTKAIMRPTT